MNAVETTGQGSQYVLFKVSNETYALEIQFVQEVLRHRTIKQLPHSPKHVLGVINLRGQIIPIVGLREKFSIQSEPVNDHTRIIITLHAKKLVGLVVDSVDRVVYIKPANIEENPEYTDGETKTAVRAIARLDDIESVIIILELANIADSESFNSISGA